MKHNFTMTIQRLEPGKNESIEFSLVIPKLGEKDTKNIKKSIRYGSPLSNYGTFSMVGSHFGGGGQCYDSLQLFPSFILDFWKERHLNDLQAGTEKQCNYLNSIGLTHYANQYDECCKALEKKGLFSDYGLEFGRGWYVKPLVKRTMVLFLEKLLAYVEQNQKNPDKTCDMSIGVLQCTLALNELKERPFETIAEGA